MTAPVISWKGYWMTVILIKTAKAFRSGGLGCWPPILELLAELDAILPSKHKQLKLNYKSHRSPNPRTLKSRILLQQQTILQEKPMNSLF